MTPIDKEERRIQKAHIALMRNPKFALYSGIMMVGEVKIDEDFPTAATNGRDCIYGREFVKKLNDKELAFVILHENMHKAYQHLTVWKKLYKENPQLANMACDYVINIELYDYDPQQSTIAMPKVGGLLDARFRGMNSKQVFDILKQEGQGQGRGGGFDQHDWDGADSLSKEEKEQLTKEIDAALRQGLMAAKKVGKEKGSGAARELQDLLEPKVDWRDELRDMVKSVCRTKDKSSWRRVNRRFLAGGDTYMPSMIGETIGRILLGVDTSGSIGEELKDFMSEVKFLAEELQPEGIDLLYWGSGVVGHETYNRDEMQGLITSTRPKDGGGTSPSCVTEYIEQNKLKPEISIMFTDGVVGTDWGGSWPSPVIWCVVGNKSANATTGKTIHVEN